MAPARVPNAAVWDALRSWIDSHEAQERANGVSAITSAQVEVISNLIKVEEKPDADGRNYVVELNQHSQKQHAGSVDYSKEDHIPPGALGGGGRWRVFCKLSWCNQIFPQPGYGFTEGQEPPSFPSKKLAKQFAAKMAMQYIHDRASSQDLASIVDTKPVSLVPQNRDGDSISSPPPKKAKRELPQSDGNGVTASNGIPVKPIPTKSDLASGSNLREGESSGSNGAQKDSPKIQAMVQQLATRLNYKVPTYTIDVEPNRPGFFRGEAVWRKEPLAPEQPIRVGGVFGEAQATEQLAAKVYEWLGQQGEKREADLAAILADIAQSKLSQAASG